MNKKVILTVLVLVILVIGVGVGVFLVQKNIEIREKAAPATNISLTSDTNSPIVGQNFSALVNINTGENQVIGAEMYITFDADKLEIISVNEGTFLPNPVVIGPDIDNTQGTLSYTIYIPPGSIPVDGVGTLAVIEFKALNSGSASVSFTSDSKVGAVQEGGVNVLVGTTPLNLNITDTNALTLTPTGTVITQTLTPTTTLTSAITSSPTPTEIENLGGANETPTNTPTQTSTSTSTPTSINPAVEQGETDLPNTGISSPTLVLMISGLLIIFIAFVIAL